MADTPMNILHIAAEVSPFAKVGGLADVVGSLPQAQAALGMNTAIVMPRYGLIQPDELNATFHQVACEDATTLQYWAARMTDNPNVRIFFIEHPGGASAQKAVYPANNPGQEFENFRFLSQAVFQLIAHVPIFSDQPAPVDILHCHDWHTALIPETLNQYKKQSNPLYANTHSVLTIHNLAFQGVESRIDGEKLNWLRSGLLAADSITTVSPRYAIEIQTEAFGCGLENLLRQRSNDLHGILNGIDTELYNPATDVFIPKRYDIQTVLENKPFCKAALQQEIGLPVEPDIPLIGFVGRLYNQKGIALILEAIQADLPVQWVILGHGDPVYEQQLQSLCQSRPNIRALLGFHIALSHKIYAGCDMFAMPSEFEPCGLGQMIALRYGTVPVVHLVGGLTDTVFDARQLSGMGNGFGFKEFKAESLTETLRIAIEFYETHRWLSIIERGMKADFFGWQQSAQKYEALYQSLVRHTIAS